MLRILSALLACLFVLPAFAQGAATLSWTPPSEFTDGTPLNPATDLSGYGVYVDGQRSGTAPPTATTFVVEDLAYGTHEFYVTAIALNGNESDMSNVVTRTIVDTRKPRPPTLLEVIVAWIRRIFLWFV